jgi:hypothetical protein
VFPIGNTGRPSRRRHPRGGARDLEALSARDHLHHDAVALAVRHVDGFVIPDGLARRRPRTPIRACAERRNPARRALLATLQADVSLEAVGVALVATPIT